MELTKPAKPAGQLGIRFATALLLIAITYALIRFGSTLAISLFVFAVFALAHREMLLLHPKIKAQKNNFLTAFYFLPVLLLFPSLSVLFLFFFILALLTPLWGWSQTHGNSDFAEKLQVQSYKFFSLAYIAFPMWIIWRLLFLTEYQFLIFLGIACTALGDTFAYLGGRLIGKHKLAPRISPNKTREGAICALVGGLAGSLLLHFLFKQTQPYWVQITVGVTLAVLGILGDLSESVLKRSFGVKDSGNLLPGHGGVLDRIDAYLFTLPLVYFYGLWMTA